VSAQYCPHCESGGISNQRKLFLFPWATAKCPNCGEMVTVPMRSLMSIFPLLMAYMIVVGAPGGAFVWRAIYGAILVGLAAYFQVHLVPLIKR